MMTKYIRRGALALLAALTVFASCSEQDEVAQTDGRAAVTLRLAIANEGLTVYTRAGESDSIVTRQEKDTLRKVWYVIADADGRVLDLPYNKLSNDNSQLLIEGLSYGTYTVAFLATTDAADAADVKAPRTLNDPWLSAKDGKPVLDKNFFYGKTVLHVGYDQADIDRTVTLARCVSRVEVDMQLPHIYMRRFVKSVRLTFDTPVGRTLTAGGELAGEQQVRELDITRDPSFITFPGKGNLSGYVDIVSTTSDSVAFTRRYRFEDCKVEAGKVERIKLAYSHPEARDGRIHVRPQDYAYMPHLDTMFLANEKASVYYRMKNPERQFKVQSPLQVSIRNKQLYVKLFAPKPVTNCTVKARFKGVSSQQVVLAKFDALYPFMEASFDLPITDGACTFETESGQLLEMPQMKNLSAGDVTLTVDTEGDPYMDKIRTIKGNWDILFDHVSYNWSYELTPTLCRNAIALVTNMAYMFSSKDFEDKIKPLCDNNQLRWWAGGTTHNIDYETIRKKVQGNIWLRCGNCGGYGGMGSNAFYWLAPYCWTNHYYDMEAKSGALTYSRQAIFHEFGHVIGYSHDSDMTYGNGKWWQNCAQLYVDMGREGKLPVNHSSEVSSLPMK